MKTILVTGATGFVGSHALKQLSQIANINLIAACRDSSKLPKIFTGEVRQGDIRDEVYLSNLFNNVDVVVNAIAWSSIWGRASDSNKLFLQPSLKLIDYFMQSLAKKYINLSSTTVSATNGSHDALSPGKAPIFWPHFANAIKIENHLRQLANDKKTIINLRFGIFVGENYALGLLPILVPRLKSHLVPWVAGGQTTMPIIDGRDIGQAIALAATNESLSQYQSFNAIGPTMPKVREVIEFLNSEYQLPKPHFNVPFFIAYRFAWLMEKLDSIVPWEPLIVRSIILLLEETHTNNDKISQTLGYQPQYHWKESIKSQMTEMSARQKSPMKMAKPTT